MWSFDFSCLAGKGAHAAETIPFHAAILEAIKWAQSSIEGVAYTNLLHQNPSWEADSQEGLRFFYGSQMFITVFTVAPSSDPILN